MAQCTSGARDAISGAYQLGNIGYSTQMVLAAHVSELEDRYAYGYSQLHTIDTNQHPHPAPARRRSVELEASLKLSLLRNVTSLQRRLRRARELLAIEKSREDALYSTAMLETREDLSASRVADWERESISWRDRASKVHPQDRLNQFKMHYEDRSLPTAACSY